MARPGITEDTVKHSANKLLSQGIAPSVQKIRETLGTGSNTTIAQYLKIWREEYETKQVHYLPTHMPKELISTFEVLWQTAMEHAAKQLEAIKAELTAEQEALTHNKAAAEQQLNEIQTNLIQAQHSIEEKNHQLQMLQTQLAVTQERLQQKTDEVLSTKAQYEARLQHTQEEKHQAIEKTTSLESAMARLKQDYTEQQAKQQASIQQERMLQEQSEVRWLNMIDQAREETNQLRKKHKKVLNEKSHKIDELQSKWSEKLNQHTLLQSLLKERDKTIEALSKQNTQLQSFYNKAKTDLAIAELKLKQTSKRKKKSNQLEQA